MSEGINQVFLFGNLGADSELKHTSVGPVLKFSLATTRSWLDKESQSKKEDTQWHRITVFGRRGESLEKFLKKGSRVFIQGRLHTSSYEKDGQKKYSTEIIAEDVQFGGGKNASSSADDAPSMPPPSATNGGFNRRPTESFEQIPF